MTTDLVWYVAYGSNLCRPRFQLHLGAGRDPTPPRADRPLTLDHELWFSGESRVWTGGIAFLDHRPRAGVATLARAWLVTHGQWVDLLARESGRPVDHDIDPRCAAQGTCRAVGPGKYDVVVGLGEHEGVPVVSFTGRGPLDHSACTAPAAAYLQRIVDGLVDAHGIDVDEAVAYLCARPGVALGWTPESLRAALGDGARQG